MKRVFHIAPSSEAIYPWWTLTLISGVLPCLLSAGFYSCIPKERSNSIQLISLDYNGTNRICPLNHCFYIFISRVNMLWRTCGDERAICGIWFSPVGYSSLLYHAGPGSGSSDVASLTISHLTGPTSALSLLVLKEEKWVRTLSFVCQRSL